MADVCDTCGEESTPDHPKAIFLTFEDGEQVWWHNDCVPEILVKFTELPKGQKNLLWAETEKWLKDKFGRSY